MSIATGILNLLTFAQRWDADASALTVRVLCLPRVDPDQPLDAGLPTFAAAAVRLQASVVVGLDSLPVTASAVAAPLVAPPAPPAHKQEAFDALAALLNPAPRLPPAPPRVVRFRKPAPDSYLSMVGSRRLSPHLATAAEYRCALEDDHERQPDAPADIPATLRWGQVYSLALRQPNLARELGLVTELQVLLDADATARGGWVFATLDPSSDLGAVPGLAVAHAALLPPLSESRPLFTSVLFPVDRPDLPADTVIRDAQEYLDGHARLVHTDQIVDEAGDAVRLAWDDERVTDGFNQQVNPDNVLPMGIAGYRVDVREAGSDRWQSLTGMRSIGDLSIGDVGLGPFDGEGMVEVVPVKAASSGSTYWFPPWFTTWRGSSLVLSDPDLSALHRDETLGWDADASDLRLTRETTFEPAGLGEVSLRYGHDYEFRVRLADLAAGGPPPDAALPDPEPPHLTATVAFRRRRRPGPVDVLERPTREAPTLVVARPRLGHPDVLFAGRDFAEVLADLDRQRVDHAADPEAHPLRGLGLPDPDVASLLVRVEVRALANDGPAWHRLYETERPFAPDDDRLSLEIAFLDLPTLDAFPLDAVDDGPIALPTGRDLRVVLTALGRDDHGYFHSVLDADGTPTTEAARTGLPVAIELHVVAGAEPDLLADADLRGYFFRLPDPEAGAPWPTARLAQELDLEARGLTLTGPPGRRTLFAASAGLRHTLSPERSAITVSSEADLAHQWVTATRVRLSRDWYWRGLSASGIGVLRTVGRAGDEPGPAELVGTILWTPTASATAAAPLTPAGVGDPYRQYTDLVFVDAIDPRSVAMDHGGPPTELVVTYLLAPVVEDGTEGEQVDIGPLRLPVTTAPAQTPALVSAGIAQDLPDEEDPTTLPRQYLWLEFAEPPADPGDAFFVRVLATAPDPLLTDAQPATQLEPPLPIDPEWVRTIHLGQPADSAGRQAMQAVTGEAEEAPRYLVPLPEGLLPTSPELFGLFTYEIRVGHADERWCTAHGRWGPPLRVTGVHHPPPPLVCRATRTTDGVRVVAPYATPVWRGTHVRPRHPKTSLWAQLYARVQQGTSFGWTDLLLDRHRLEPGDDLSAPVRVGSWTFAMNAVREKLRLAGLPQSTSLTVLTVEFHETSGLEEPLGRELGHARILRVSALVDVPDICEP